MKILILGGTEEARQLAAQLTKMGHAVTTSLAGRTSDPLLPAVRRRRVTQYATRLYHVCWEDGDELRQSLDAQPPYLELGCL